MSRVSNIGLFFLAVMVGWAFLSEISKRQDAIEGRLDVLYSLLTIKG